MPSSEDAKVVSICTFAEKVKKKNLRIKTTSDSKKGKKGQKNTTDDGKI